MSGKMRYLVRLFLLAAISFAMPVQSQEEEPAIVVSRPDGVTLCEEKSLPATFSCPLDTTGTDIDDDDIRWHRFVRDRNATKKVDTDGEDITVVTSTTGAIINSTLTINNTRKSDTGFVWVVAQSHVYCNTSLTIVSSPSTLKLNITGNVEELSIVVQWDEVDDSLDTTYTVTWTDDRDLNDVAIVQEQTSYTITGLTLDTVYTITVSAANRCGQGPELRTRMVLSDDTTSTTSTISPTVTATTSSDDPNPTSVIINSNSLDANTVDMTLLPTSMIDPSVTDSPATIVTTMKSSPASSISTMVMTVNTNLVSTTTTTVSTTGLVVTTTSANPTPSTTTTTTTTTAIATSDVTTTTVTTTTTTTLSIAPIDTTTATASSSTVPTDTTVTAAAPTTTNTDVAVSPTPTTDLTEPAANAKGDDGFNLEDYRYIGAGVLGGLIVFIVIVVICCCCCCCRRRKGKRDVGSLKLDQYTTLSSEGSPQKDIPSVTNAMAIGVGQDGEPVKQGTITEANFTTSDTSKDLDLNSQPLHPPDTYDRLDAIKPTDPTDVYDKLQPRQPPHPTNTYDKLPPSNTFDQLPSPSAMYDKLPPSKTVHEFPSTNTYDRLPSSNTSDNLPSNTTYDKLPSTPPNTYDRLPSSNTFDKLPSTIAYDKLPSSNTFHSFPLPSTPPNHYDTPPSSRILEKLPCTPTTSDRLPATGAHTPPQTKIEEVSDSNVTNTDDGAHYYDELPCNMKKDAHTGENAYQGEDVHYAILQPLPTPKNKLIYSEDPTKLYAQIA